VTTGANNDTVVLGNGTNVVVTGAGNDTITTGTGVNTVTPGIGNDTITLNGTDTVRFAEAGATNSDSINGFSLASGDVLSFNLGGAQLVATATAAAQAASAGTFGVLQTGALSPTLGNVNGLGTGTTIAGQIINAGATATTGTTVVGTNNVLFLNGTFTDGTANGVVSALGTTATTGVATTANGKFLLVTYSVGNVAQVWSYGGDANNDTDIQASELSLVATLNGVAANSLTAAVFSTYLSTPAATASAGAASGQTISVVGVNNTITGTSNVSGQFLTAAADTINVGIGSLPTAAANSTTQGLFVLDSTTGDSDVLNATVLNQNWDLNSTFTNIETVNLTLTNSDTDGFAMSTTMPGTTAVNFFGTGNEGALSGFTSGNSIGLGAGYSGTVTLNQGATLAAVGLTLGGNSFTTTATSPTFATANTVTALTITANASGAVNLPLTNVTAATLAGSGNVTLYATAAQLDGATINASGAAYTGALTIRPSSNAAMDFTTGGVVTGVRTIDLSDTAAFNSQITLAAANNSTAFGSGAVTVNFAPLTASALGGVAVNQLGSSQTNALTVALGANATNVTGGVNVNTGINTLTITDAAPASVSVALNGITMSTGAGTQAATITAATAAAVNVGTFTGDSLTTSGVTGTVTATLANGTSPVAFTGGAGSSFVTGSGLNDSITTGIGNDAIYIPAGAGTQAVNVTGGLGNDTYSFAQTNLNGTFITDTGGTDTLAMTGASSNISTLNGGVSLVASGIEQVLVASGGVMSIATGQVTGAVNYNTVAAGGSLAVTQTTVGVTGATAVTNLSGATFTSFNYLSSAGVSTAGVAVTSTLITGASGLDVITGPNTGTNVIIGGAGADTLTGGTGTADTVSYSDVTVATSHSLTNLAGVAVNLSATAVTAATITTAMATAAPTAPVIGGADAAAGAALAAGTGAYIATSAANSTVTMVRDTLSGFENITGSALRDYLVAAAGGSVITGGTGADQMIAGAGVDTFVFTTGQSVVPTAVDATTTTANVWDATDTITFGTSTDVITGFTAGAGGDRISGFSAGLPTAALTLALGATTGSVLGTTYYLAGNYVQATGVFTITANNAGADTLVYVGNGASVVTTTSSVVLVGVAASALVAANFIA